jgi:hypothetical protein
MSFQRNFHKILALSAMALFGVQAVGAGAIMQPGYSSPILVQPESPKSPYSFRLYVITVIYEEGDPIESWPRKTKSGTPLNYQIVVFVEDLRNSQQTEDFTQEHKIDLNYEFENENPSFAGMRFMNPSAKYDCYAMGAGWMDIRFTHMGIVQMIIDGHFQAVSTQEIGAMALHGIGFAFLSSRHCSATTIITYYYGVPVFQYLGKFGLYGVYRGTRYDVEAIYGSPTKNYRYIP